VERATQTPRRYRSRTVECDLCKVDYLSIGKPLSSNGWLSNISNRLGVFAVYGLAMGMCDQERGASREPTKRTRHIAPSSRPKIRDVFGVQTAAMG
jgi:hypothetical protein